MSIEVIETLKAPKAIGTYSQAMRAGNMVFLSGQIGLNPETMNLVDGGIEAQIHQVFANLAVVCVASGGSTRDVVKVNLYLTDLSHFAKVNEIMPQYFAEPYPARAVVGVKELPKGALVEADCMMVLNTQQTSTVLA